MKSKSSQLSVLILLFLCESFCQLSKPQAISVKALNAYNSWKLSNNKLYSNDDEKSFRQLIFLDNYAKIEQHNSNPANTYKMGINQFSDLTEEEFAKRILTPNIASNVKIQQQKQNGSSSVPTVSSITSSYIPHNPDAQYAQGGIPTAVDWRSLGFNNPVKNQGSCGSCWAFSAACAMEGTNFKLNKTLKSFSEQQIVDCATKQKYPGNDGCNGGGTFQALQYATKYGLQQTHEYPYTGIQKECSIISPLSPSNKYFFPQAEWFVEYGSDNLKEAIAFAPTSVILDATRFGFYSSGVFNGCSSELNINHAVTAVGYDSNGNWIIRNSWGTQWGEGGYMKLAAGNSCGILVFPWVVVSQQ